MPDNSSSSLTYSRFITLGDLTLCKLANRKGKIISLFAICRKRRLRHYVFSQMTDNLFWLVFWLTESDCLFQCQLDRDVDTDKAELRHRRCRYGLLKDHLSSSFIFTQKCSLNILSLFSSPFTKEREIGRKRRRRHFIWLIDWLSVWQVQIMTETHALTFVHICPYTMCRENKQFASVWKWQRHENFLFP